MKGPRGRAPRAAAQSVGRLRGVRCRKPKTPPPVSVCRAAKGGEGDAGATVTRLEIVHHVLLIHLQKRRRAHPGRVEEDALGHAQFLVDLLERLLELRQMRNVHLIRLHRDAGRRRPLDPLLVLVQLRGAAGHEGDAAKALGDEARGDVGADARAGAQHDQKALSLRGHDAAGRRRVSSG